MCLPPRLNCGLGPPPTRRFTSSAGTGRVSADTSDTASWMVMGRPSKGTPWYCLMAFRASERRSNMTSAVPVEGILKFDYYVCVWGWDWKLLTQRATGAIVMYSCLLHRPEIIEQLLDVRIWYSIVQITNNQSCWSRAIARTAVPLGTIVHIMLPSAVHIALKGGSIMYVEGWLVSIRSERVGTSFWSNMWEM